MAERAAKRSGNWYRGVVDTADRFMAKWHRVETEKSWLRHVAVDPKSSNQGKPGGRGGVLIQLSTNNAETKW